MCSVHSCGIVQDVHHHGPVTSEAYSKESLPVVVLEMVLSVEMYNSQFFLLKDDRVELEHSDL